MTDFTAPQFCIGFDGEAEAVAWREIIVPIATKSFKGGAYRQATPAEQRRYGVVSRLTGSRWYKSSHTACVYPKPKTYKLADTYAAIRTAQTRELDRPSTYKLFGDGEHTAEAIKNRSGARDQETIQAAIREARYLDWLAARDAAIVETEYRMAA